MRSLLLYSGEISWMDGPAAVSIRAPLGIPLFMGAWIAGWLIFALGLGPAIECSGSGAGCGREAGRTLLVQVLPALVVIVGAFFGVLGIRRRARLLYAEVRSALRTRAQPAVP
jgi:hypothetical protein